MVGSFSKTFELMAGPCSPKHGPVLFTVLKNLFVWMLCSHLNTFKLMAGPRSSTSLSRPSVFCGDDESFGFVIVQIFNNVWMNRWSCSFKHRPGHFTVLKNFFFWMVWNFSKTFKFLAGPRSPTSPVTAQLILRRWIIISFWCCADNNQQRSNERMFVLPQTRSNALYVLEKLFRLDGMKLFKNIRVYG